MSSFFRRRDMTARLPASVFAITRPSTEQVGLPLGSPGGQGKSRDNGAHIRLPPGQLRFRASECAPPGGPGHQSLDKLRVQRSGSWQGIRTRRRDRQGQAGRDVARLPRQQEFVLAIAAPVGLAARRARHRGCLPVVGHLIVQVPHPVAERLLAGHVLWRVRGEVVPAGRGVPIARLAQEA